MSAREWVLDGSGEADLVGGERGFVLLAPQPKLGIGKGRLCPQRWRA